MALAALVKYKHDWLKRKLMDKESLPPMARHAQGKICDWQLMDPLGPQVCILAWGHDGPHKYLPGPKVVDDAEGKR